MNTNTKKELKNITLRKADRCVKCGLCSAQCPTYLLEGSENESPRGRVSLAQAIASNQIFEHQLVSHHIDSCLSCRRCEKICPSGVEVSQIVANTRNILNVEGRNSVRNLLVKLSARATYNDWKKISGLFHTLKRTGFFRLFPKLAPIREYINPALNINPRITDDQTAETIFLFAGCASQILDQATIKDSQELLGLCGYLVSIPDKQVCCGALPHHKGLLETAKQCETTNLRAFKHEQIPVI
ncbi:MAG: (Fe-S)-binding protein, partial [Gammaproteobacteria bacterium]|nr:(Fe-S)-binding protein [Gammaproteobacteria bacterium]